MNGLSAHENKAAIATIDDLSSFPVVAAPMLMLCFCGWVFDIRLLRHM